MEAENKALYYVPNILHYFVHYVIGMTAQQDVLGSCKIKDAVQGTVKLGSRSH